MLKIQSWSVDDQRNAVSGVVESIVSSIGYATPLTAVVSLNQSTTFGTAVVGPTELPFASQTRNFAGTVLPCFHTLVPSALIGCRIVWPAEPRHVPVAGAYRMLSVPVTNVRL